MRFILLLLPFICNTALAQQKESTVSISCYVNPELYLKAGVIAQVSDKAGNASCNGNYVMINNQSGSTFHYKFNNRWIALAPQGKIIIMPSANNVSSKSPSIFRLDVKYTPDQSNLGNKIRLIAQMNAKTDEINGGELGSGISKKPKENLNKPSNEALAKVNKPSTVKPSNTPPTKATEKDIEEKVVVKTAPKTAPKQDKPLASPAKGRVVVKAKPKAPPKQNKPNPVSERTHGIRNTNSASATAVGLRIDFGKGSAGLGPNIKQRFNRNLSLDAALVFFDGDEIGLGAQIEQNFPVGGTPELNWYVGIGPQFLFGDENTAIALVPVTGLEYNIPGAPLNLSFDWRPSFYLSPGADVEAARFGLSLRVAF